MSNAFRLGSVSKDSMRAPDHQGKARGYIPRLVGTKWLASSALGSLARLSSDLGLWRCVSGADPGTLDLAKKPPDVVRRVRLLLA